MIPYIRQRRILEVIDDKEILSFDDIATLLNGVSPSTIRRDLKQLEKTGKIEILQGGAARSLKNSSQDIPLLCKQHANLQQKDKIARYAANLVYDGQVIYIDSGTTAFAMIKYLKHKKIKIVTSNILVLSQLEDVHFNCYILGGEIERTLGSVFGSITENLLKDMYFDKSFIGVTGCSFDHGLTASSFPEANKKRIVMEHSSHSYVLVDSSKFGNRSFSKAFDVDKCTVITDKKVPDLYEFPHYIVAH